MEIILILIVAIIAQAIRHWRFQIRRKQRRDYYRNVYLKSDKWKRKRYVVLKRNNWCCVYCGAPATEVHHKRYARTNIGKEPIKWLVSICRSCHDAKHYKFFLYLFPFLTWLLM
ncbi:MAG: HNH endonuclease [Heyndrickxia sp.]